MTLQIDAQGRINIPESLRESLHLHSGDHLNARLEYGRIVLEPVVAESNSETTAELLLETNGMLIWTGTIPGTLSRLRWFWASQGCVQT
jgi:AbrB family looped-hinge helix DNA binding protein